VKSSGNVVSCDTEDAYTRLRPSASEGIFHRLLAPVSDLVLKRVRLYTVTTVQPS